MWRVAAVAVVALAGLGTACDGGGEGSGGDAGGGFDVASDVAGGDGSGDASDGLAPQVSVDRAFESVDPFVGTAGSGFGYAALTPAAQVPNGMVRLGPDTSDGALAPAESHFSGYHHEDGDVRGFSHTRLVGTGADAYGNLSWRPLDGIDRDEPWAGWSPMDKSTEKAEPGYYRVRLEKPDVRVELSATTHGGVQRYRPKADSLVLAFDAASVLSDGATVDAQVREPESGRLEGRAELDGDFATRSRPLELYFSTTVEPVPDEVVFWGSKGLDRSADRAEGETAGAVLRFEKLDSPVVVRTGLSYVDAQQARLHRSEELGGTSFEKVRERAAEAWREKLRRVRIRSDDREHTAMFYTALYNVWRMPTRFSGRDGRYRGFDGQIHRAKGFDYYTELSLWDTFRTLHPLLILVDPALQRDSLKSLVAMGEQGGHVPRWPAGASYTNSMIGTSADIVFAGSHLKGIDGVDYGRAFDLLMQSATKPADGSDFAGREAVEDYLDLGYVPADRDESVSRTLEYAWADRALGLMAKSLGRSEAGALLKRGDNWQHLFDADTSFFLPKRRDGSFADDIDTEDYGGRSGPYTEGNAWHWRFYAFQRPAKLVETWGGEKAMFEKLSAFFEESALGSSEKLETFLPDLRYWHGNEHDLHAAYLFPFVGRSDRASHWIRRIQRRAYTLEPNGIPGNDDGGTLTSWYVLSAMGIYPIAGTGRYVTGAPLFEEIRIEPPDGPNVRIVAPGADIDSAPEYRVRVGTSPVDGPTLTHDQLTDGTVRFSAE